MLDADGLQLMCVEGGGGGENYSPKSTCNMQDVFSADKEREGGTCGEMSASHRWVSLWLQRNVFNLLLIQAAMRSRDKHHNKLAR